MQRIDDRVIGDQPAGRNVSLADRVANLAEPSLYRGSAEAFWNWVHAKAAEQQAERNRKQRSSK